MAFGVASAVKLAAGAAIVYLGYEVVQSHDLIQRAEALFYSFPATRSQAASDYKNLQKLLAYAQQVGDQGLITEVQARITSVLNQYPSVGSSTAASTALTATTVSTIATGGSTASIVAALNQATGHVRLALASARNKAGATKDLALASQYASKAKSLGATSSQLTPVLNAIASAGKTLGIAA